MKNVFKATGLVALSILLMTSCKKYDEGGSVNRTEKNLVKSWKLEKYLRNSVDETSLLIITGYEETYSDNGNLSRTFTEEDGTLRSETGTWKFDKDLKKLNVSGLGSVEITAVTGTVSSSYYNILKLDKDEFWYYYTNGSDKHEFHLIKK
jgi:hypothetical protein